MRSDRQKYRYRREDAFRQVRLQGFWRKHKLAFGVPRLTARSKAPQFCLRERMEGAQVPESADLGLSPVFIYY